MDPLGICRSKILKTQPSLGVYNWIGGNGGAVYLRKRRQLDKGVIYIYSFKKGAENGRVQT